MPALLILAVAAMGLVLVVLAVVVVGIRLEPSAQELTRQAPSLMARLARRLLGVYVRRPDRDLMPDQDFRILGGIAPRQEHQPAEHPDHQQVGKANEHERRG